MPLSLRLTIVLCSMLVTGCLNAQTITGTISNNNGKSLPFATIKLGATQQGIIADLNGHFSISYQPAITFIEVSYTGHESKKIPITATTANLLIVLNTTKEELAEVIISAADVNKAKKIMNKVVENKHRHNPDKYSRYRCNVYYKMVAGIDMPDTLSNPKKDSAKDNTLRKLLANQHLFVTETKSIRHWKRPQQLQEEVTASRMSGLKTPLFTNIITDILPFHAYNDFININGKDYASPLSKGLHQRFRYKLIDEILQGTDTIWMIDFTPRKNQEDLRGTLFIHSNGFAVKHLLAYTKDTILQRSFGIEQQYTLVDNKWFPEKLNYLIDWTLSNDSVKTNVYMKGTSVIDSVSWEDQKGFRFNKSRTVIIQDGAINKTENAWATIRPVALDAKEDRTYHFMDSLSRKKNLDRLVTYAGKLTEGKFPVGPFDINLGRIYNYNRYEKSRVGLGLQTNDKLSNHFSVGGWAGYGFGDKQWKYGGFGEIYLDKFKDNVFKVSYSKDIKDPGRLQINKDLDKNYLRLYLLNRVDMVERYAASVQNRIGYFNTEISGAYEKTVPQYAYAWENDGRLEQQFTSYEATLNMRYAFGERRVPAFGKYHNAGTRYPILYGRFNIGKIKEGNIPYHQLIGAISWHKKINRVGTEKFLLIGGLSQSNKNLPLSKLFAGNGFALDRLSVHVFGGMQTMLPYEYYMDRFVNFYWQHDFDFRLYNLKIGSGTINSVPNPAFAVNTLWGNMAHTSAHQFVSFNVPTKAYTEAGLLLNRLLRLKYLNLYYLNLNLGYFQQLTPGFTLKNKGRFVVGFGVDL